MTDDTQVAQLLRSATSDLELPTDLVARASSRGRSRRRRNLAGTTLVSLAFVGLGAVAVPHLLPAGTSEEPGFSATPSSRTLTVPTPGHRVPIKSTDGATVLKAMLGEFGTVTDASNDDDVRSAGVRVGAVKGVEVGSVASRAVLNGGTVEATVDVLHSYADTEKAKQLNDTLTTAREECGFGQDAACQRLADGSYFRAVTSREKEPGMEAVRQTKATVWTTDGYVIELIAFNARPISETEVEFVPGRAPVLAVAQLQQLATDSDWFRAAP
jgi:hypothetical protein